MLQHGLNDGQDFLTYLRMLCDAFRDPSGAYEKAPKDTNGVERINQGSKQSFPTCLITAMEYICIQER